MVWIHFDLEKSELQESRIWVTPIIKFVCDNEISGGREIHQLAVI